MKTALRHIRNDCALCHANKVKDVRPMGECVHITGNLWLCVPVAPHSFYLILSLFSVTFSFSLTDVLTYLFQGLWDWIKWVLELLNVKIQLPLFRWRLKKDEQIPKSFRNYSHFLWHKGVQSCVQTMQNKSKMCCSLCCFYFSFSVFTWSF